ncbi:peroxiredoxin (alkyl hydroperoxide reductase subunit C) [Fusarium oxysporum f. sp. lycopersici MN25]|nr:peroxiredoxin (alkyl hydroperoxide reductase subunit C) [Fusarium oxysporum f. sp. lycopersici MN25]
MFSQEDLENIAVKGIAFTIRSVLSGDKEGVVTPIDWQVGEDAFVPPSVSTEDAKKKFGDVREVKPYLRFTKA